MAPNDAPHESSAGPSGRDASEPARADGGGDAKRRDGEPPRAEEATWIPDRDWVEEQRSSFRYAGVGLQFGLTLCLFALAGHWLDGRFGTGPWMLLTGVLLGFGGGTLSLVKKFG